MKKETFAEFLARGGKVTKVPSQEHITKSETVRSTVQGGPAVIMSLGEADLFYGEKKTRKTKPKAKATIDLNALPPELRKKYVDDVIAANEDEDDD
jgi:hypothetical protein